MKNLKTNSRQGGMLAPWSPFPESRFFNWSLPELFSENIPSLNIREDDNHYVVELAVPGMKKEDFDIDVNGRMITISADKEERSEDYSRKEYDYSSFSRSFTLPEYANLEKIMARYEDGILKLEIPKTPEGQKQKGQKIKVQ